MKITFLIFTMFLVLNVAFANESCKEISCFTKNDVAENPFKFDKILYKTLKTAKGCKNKGAVTKILMSSSKVMGYVSMEEDMSKFIEHEFVANPECILSSFNKLSFENKKTISHFLQYSTYINGKTIGSILNKMEQKYPSEIIFIKKSTLKSNEK